MWMSFFDCSSMVATTSGWQCPVAQTAMRAAIPGIGLALLIASTLHAVATGNLLPARIPTVCVDVNPAVPTKLADRGSFQAVGLVMDAASFLRDVARELGWKG